MVRSLCLVNTIAKTARSSRRVQEARSLGLPVRSIITGRRDGYSVRIPSYRTGRVIECESLLEGDFCVLAEVDPSVVRIIGQPLTVTVEADGKLHAHTLDFYVEHDDGRKIMWAVRAACRMFTGDPKRDSGTRIFFEAVAAAVRQTGCEFRIATEREIRIEPRLHNAKLILRGSGPLFDPQVLFAVRAAVGRLPSPFSIAEIRDELPGVDVTTTLMRLIWLGELRADMARRFDNETLLHRR